MTVIGIPACMRNSPVRLCHSDPATMQSDMSVKPEFRIGYSVPFVNETRNTWVQSDLPNTPNVRIERNVFNMEAIAYLYPQDKNYTVVWRCNVETKANRKLFKELLHSTWTHIMVMAPLELGDHTGNHEIWVQNKFDTVLKKWRLDHDNLEAIMDEIGEAVLHDLTK